MREKWKKKGPGEREPHGMGDLALDISFHCLGSEQNTDQRRSSE